MFSKHGDKSNLSKYAEIHSLKTGHFFSLWIVLGIQWFNVNPVTAELHAHQSPNTQLLMLMLIVIWIINDSSFWQEAC